MKETREEKIKLLLKRIMLVHEANVKCNSDCLRYNLNVCSLKGYIVFKLLDEYRDEYMSESVKKLYS